MKVGDRVFVNDYAKAGVLLGWDGVQYEVRLYDDPDYVTRWVAFWDIESIEAHEWGEDPELDRRVEAGLEIIEELLNKHMPNEAPQEEEE